MSLKPCPRAILGGTLIDGTGRPPLNDSVVLIKGDRVIAVGANRVVRDKDPTAHAEIVAIREACNVLGDHRLSGCELFTTTEPCPMCLAAVYWARMARVYFATTRGDAKAIGFDDKLIYDELACYLSQRKIPMIKVETKEGLLLLGEWNAMPHKVIY